jgi:hypothetical protein
VHHPQLLKPSTCRGRSRSGLWRERLRGDQEGVAHRVMGSEQDAHAARVADCGGNLIWIIHNAREGGYR